MLIDNLAPFFNTIRLVNQFYAREFVPNKRNLSTDNCNDTLPLRGPVVNRRLPGKQQVEDSSLHQREQQRGGGQEGLQ